MDRVYVANFGEGNALWPVAKEIHTIITIDNVEVHPFWRGADTLAAIVLSKLAEPAPPTRDKAQLALPIL